MLMIWEAVLLRKARSLRTALGAGYKHESA